MDDLIAVADEPLSAGEQEVYRIVWVETAPLRPAPGEPGFQPQPAPAPAPGDT